MEVILLFIGGYIFLGIAVWIIKQIQIFIETIQYTTKLNKLSPAITELDIDSYSARFNRIIVDYDNIIKLLQSKFHICQEKIEANKSVDQYIHDEAQLRRSLRKPAKRSRSRHYSRY